MIRLLIRLAVFFSTGALGLVAAWLLLDDFHLSAPGFITAVVVFSAVQSAVAPLATKLADRYASTLVSGIGLISTVVALFVASLFSGGLRIDGFTTWVAATLVVWLFTALGAWLIPLFILKQRKEQ